MIAVGSNLHRAIESWFGWNGIVAIQIEIGQAVLVESGLDHVAIQIVQECVNM